MKTKEKTTQKDPSRDRTRLPGQNPRANDAPDQDVYHDDNRHNPFEPEVGKSVKEEPKRGRGS